MNISLLPKFYVAYFDISSFGSNADNRPVFRMLGPNYLFHRKIVYERLIVGIICNAKFVLFLSALAPCCRMRQHHVVKH